MENRVGGVGSTYPTTLPGPALSKVGATMSKTISLQEASEWCQGHIEAVKINDLGVSGDPPAGDFPPIPALGLIALKVRDRAIDLGAVELLGKLPVPRIFGVTQNQLLERLMLPKRWCDDQNCPPKPGVDVGADAVGRSGSKPGVMAGDGAAVTPAVQPDEGTVSKEERTTDVGETADVIQSLLAATGDECTIAIFNIAQDISKSADDKMREIAAIDRRFLGWKSPKWAKLLRVTPDAIRQTEWWRVDRKQRIEDEKVKDGHT